MHRRLVPAALAALLLAAAPALSPAAHAADRFNAFVEDPSGDTVLAEPGDGSTAEDVYDQADLVGFRVKDGYSQGYEVGLLRASWKVADLTARRKHAEGEKQVFIADLAYTYTAPGAKPEGRHGLLKVKLGKGRSFTVYATGGKHGAFCRASSKDPLTSTEYVGFAAFKPSKTLRIEFFDWCIDTYPERVTGLSITPRMLAKAPSPGGVVVDEKNTAIEVPDKAFG